MGVADPCDPIWRAALASGSSKSDLEAACKTMKDSAKPAMQAYGCIDF